MYVSPRASHVGNFKVALNNNKKKKRCKGFYFRKVLTRLIILHQVSLTS